MGINDKHIHLCAAGSPDFARRVASQSMAHCKTVSYGSLAEMLSLVMTNRSNVLVFEIGPVYSAKQHGSIKKTLQTIRERLGNGIYITAALTAPEKFSFGGDLLFSNRQDFSHSDLIDTFMVLPPASLPDVPTLTQQLMNVISLCNLELIRRIDGEKPLPPLGHQHWVQSQADPESRELWMRWLPRYATYVNESPIIIGRTGTGKTKLAYALHNLSGREGQFVSITPRDFSSSELVQAELFGAVAGAYTGAVDKWGLVKSAEKGTLFIDELQSIDKDLQGKLITFIENKVYRRVGSAERIEADVRFVFASNKSLEEMIAQDILRDDFAYRLERVQLQLLPLNRRRLDIPAALAYSLAKIHRQRPRSAAIMGLSPSAYRTLFCHSWPGNLRQLENTTAQLCELADFADKSIIDEQIVNSALRARPDENTADFEHIVARAAERISNTHRDGSISSLEAGVEKFSEHLRISAVEVCSGNLEKAAALLNDNPAALQLFLQGVKAKKELEG